MYAIDRFASFRTDWEQFYKNGGIIIADRYTTSNMVHQMVSALLPAPIVRITPRNAMYANREQIPLKEALHRIAGETIAYYPPGIPCVAVGEEISASVLQYIENRKALGYVPNGSDDMTLETIWVLQE